MVKDFTFYFSGLETGTETTEKFLQSGRRIRGGMMSYLTTRGGKKYTDWLVRFRKNYGGKVMIDSGAHAFIYAENVEAGTIKGVWHPVSAEIDAIMKDPDKYVHGYMDWLEQNRDAYDWAVEFDVQKIVGQDKVNAWRKEFIARKIPLVIVLHPRAGDTLDTLREWKAQGVEYFGRGEFDDAKMEDIVFVRAMSAEGVKVHVFAFSPTTLSRHLDYLDSSDSSSWLAAGKVAQLLVARGRTYQIFPIKDNPLAVKKAVLGLSTVMDKTEMEEQIKNKKYLALNWNNMFEFQKMVDNLVQKTGYQQVIQMAGEGNAIVPTWAGGKDRLGRSKEIYLKSRFNAVKSGMYAREVQKNALECNICLVKDVCPLYEQDALCGFLPIWRRGGAKTRNREQVIRMMEDVVAEQFVRLQRGQFMEARQGGAPDRQVSDMENNLIKNLELLHRVKFGSIGGGMNVALNVGKEGVQLGVGMSVDQLLNEVRDEYGDRLVTKIKKRAVDAEAVVIEDGQQRGTQEQVAEPNTV